jgi:hypothetical protein
MMKKTISANQQRQWRQAEAADPFGEMARQADVAHGQRQEGRAGEDQRDHAVEAGGAHQAVAESSSRRATSGWRRDQAADHAERGGFGGGGDAAVDRAQHQRDQQHDRDQVARGIELLPKRHAFGRRRHLIRMKQRPDHDPAHEQLASIRPGQTPPMNSLAIETLAATPYTIMMIDGGISRPSVPAPASVPMVMDSG